MERKEQALGQLKGTRTLKDERKGKNVVDGRTSGGEERWRAGEEVVWRQRMKSIRRAKETRKERKK